MQDVSGGSERVRRWPRKRPGPGNPKQRAVRAKFQEAQAMAHYLAPACRLFIEKAVAHSPLLPRDVVTMQAFNRWFAVQLPDGRTLWPMPARLDVSEALDVLGPIEEGWILVRGPKYWEPKAPPGAGGGLGVRFTLPNLLFESGDPGDWDLDGFVLDTEHEGLLPWGSSHAAYQKSGGDGALVERELNLLDQFTPQQLDAGGVLTLSLIWGNWGTDRDHVELSVEPRAEDGDPILNPLVYEPNRFTNNPRGWQPHVMTVPMPPAIRRLFVRFESRVRTGSVANVAVQGLAGFLTIPAD